MYCLKFLTAPYTLWLRIFLLHCVYTILYSGRRFRTSQQSLEFIQCCFQAGPLSATLNTPCIILLGSISFVFCGLQRHRRWGYLSSSCSWLSRSHDKPEIRLVDFRRWPNAVLILAKRQRRRAIIKLALGQHPHAGSRMIPVFWRRENGLPFRIGDQHRCPFHVKTIHLSELTKH